MCVSWETKLASSTASLKAKPINLYSKKAAVSISAIFTLKSINRVISLSQALVSSWNQLMTKSVQSKPLTMSQHANMN